MNVIHLPYGAGLSTSARALRAQGINAISCSLRPGNVYDAYADIRVDFQQYPSNKREAVRKAFFQKTIQKYDVFHFHFGETFFSDKSDLKVLKKMGKKMVVEHRGSEVRMLSIARKFNNPYVRVKPSWTEAKIRSNLKLLSSYINHAIVPDLELVPYIEPYYKYIHVVPRAMDASQFTPQYPSQQSKPLIVHAPSNRDLKGTEYIITAVERLKAEGYLFDFNLLEKISHAQVLSLYQRATIVIDQILIGSYANLSMEAMAMGKPVICYIREDLRSVYSPDLPIVSANPVTIYTVLKDLLNHPERWTKLGMEGHRYIEQHHSFEGTAKELVKIYRSL